MCGGIIISNNSFKNNIGCYNSHGAIYLYCFDTSLKSDPNIVKYV